MDGMEVAIELALEQLQAFCDRTAWHRSNKQNLVREWNGLTVTVFQYRGKWSWSIRRDGEPRYSKANYANEDEAIESVGLDLLRP